MRRTSVALAATTIALLATTVTTTTATAAPTPVSVLGTARIDTGNPATGVFDVFVHGHGDGRSGTGVVWMSHHNDELVGWMVVRVDCVRKAGRVGIVTGVVSDAQDFLAGPGDRISLTVDDRRPRDRIGFAAQGEAQRCRGPRADGEITGGDLRVSP